jgi:hypothetical protein
MMNKKSYLHILKETGLALLLLILPLSIGGTVNKEDRSLPKQIREWKAESKDQSYDRKTIYKYIDGGAELYLTYDFQQVISRKYTGPGNSEIILDIYCMGSPADAFGLFTSEREDKDADIGQGSEFGGGLLRFWKGNFFVSILANGGGENAASAVLELGKMVDASIDSTGIEPDLLRFLPKLDNLDKKKTRYFHTSLLLDKHYYVANENILFLSPKTGCVLAEYPLAPNSKDAIILLVIKYENDAKAKEAFDNFIRIYMPEAKGTGVAQMENKKWTSAKYDKNIVKIVFEAPGKEQALEFISNVKFW